MEGVTSGEAAKKDKNRDKKIKGDVEGKNGRENRSGKCPKSVEEGGKMSI